MTGLTRARTAGLAIGAVVAAAAVAAVVALVAFELPGHTAPTISLSAQPPAAGSVATCAGPILATGRDSTQAGFLADAAAQQIVQGAGDGAEAERDTLAAVDVPGGSGPEVFTAQPVDGARTDLAAAGSASVDDTDLRGFAASACVRAQMESWLVAGSGTTGAADVILLANPGDVPALVSLSVYGAAGLVEPPAGSGIVVAPGAQRVIPLASLALGEENPIVRVTSQQAPVQASVQTSLTRVLLPGGVDQIAAVGAPESSLVIPGVRVTLAPGDPGASDVPTSLRLLAPAAAGTATVTIIGQAGQVGEARVVPLTAGVPLQLDLDGLPVGTYTVRVASTTPVTGAVWSTTGFGAGSDFGWFTGAGVLAEPTLVAVASGPSPVLVLASDEGADQVVTVSDADGQSAREVAVPAGGSVEVTVDAGVFLVTPGAPGIRVGVSYAGAGAIAGYPVRPGDAAAAAILVYPR